MQLPPLTEGRILDRYKRFLADVELADGQVITVHCPNTGSMRGCWAPGAPVQISHSDNPKRKLAWTLERVDMGGGWIGVNTHRVNPVVGEGLREGRVAGLAGYAEVRAESAYRNPRGEGSRFDFRLSGGDGSDAFVEVKNTTLLEDGELRFPDAVSERGRKHLLHLADAVAEGMRGVILFALNRPEGKCFAPAAEIDPAYAETLGEVSRRGVEVLALRIEHGAQDMCLGAPVSVTGI